MALKYTTVQKFWKFLGINDTVLDYQPGNAPSRETVATTPVTATGDYHADQMGVNEDTLVLYVGSSDTALTLTTDYTFDSDTGKISITSAGAVTVTGEDLTAAYEYSQLGKDLNYNETVRLLEQAENGVDDSCNCVFADQSEINPNYLKVSDELDTGKGAINNLYDVNWGPVIKINTTSSGDYTTGGTSLTLSDASGLPTAATIYIGGNKVSYTSRSSNVLTIPSDTPSISGGATTRGEVVELSTSPSGVDPTFTVITPDSDYNMDYDTGEIQIANEYYFQEDTTMTKPQDGLKGRIRYTYLHAWHQPGQDAVVPEEIEETVYMKAGRKLVGRTILKSLTGQRDNFNPQSFGFSKVDIEDNLKNYRVLKFRNV